MAKIGVMAKSISVDILDRIIKMRWMIDISHVLTPVFPTQATPSDLRLVINHSPVTPSI